MAKMIVTVALLISGCAYGAARISSALDTLQTPNARIDARIARNLR